MMSCDLLPSSVLDGRGSRRRVQLSTSLREISVSPLNARVPLPGLCAEEVSYTGGGRGGEEGGGGGGGYMEIARKEVG